MPSQTRFSIPVLVDSAIEALRDSLMESMREEMDRLRVELRNNATKTNSGTMGRQNNEGQRPMQFSRVTKIEFLKFGRQYERKAQAAFKELKKAIIHASVLQIPDFEATFMVETDASGLGFDYEIVYKKGCENVAADALQRLPNTEELMQITMSTFPADDKNSVKHYEWSAQQLLRKAVGHSGVQATIKRMSAQVYWRKMKKEVKEWIRNCVTCQRFKPELVPSLRLLQPLPISEKVWTYISMDFVNGLPMSKGLHISIAYHPQTDGQTKVVNMCVECYLRQATSAHVAYTTGDNTNESMDRCLTAREAVVQLLKFHLMRAHDRMKAMAHKIRTEKVFGIDDLVLLKLQPYRKPTLRQHQCHKLAPKYYGPFKIVYLPTLFISYYCSSPSVSLTMSEDDQNVDVAALPKFDMPLHESEMTANDVKLLAIRHGLNERYFELSGIRVPFSTFLVGRYQVFSRTYFPACAVKVEPVNYVRVVLSKSRGFGGQIFRETFSGLKGWKRRFFFLDKRTISDDMAWRHHDSDVNDLDLEDRFNALDDFPSFRPIFKDTEGNVVIMSEYLRFPFLSSASILKGHALTPQDQIKQHTTHPLPSDQTIPAKTDHQKRVEVEDPKIVA
nr:hypothetical protein [Tanacetum cinerariifolium]